MAEPASAVMLGDGPNDVLAARRAGLAVIAIEHGDGCIAARELGADLVIGAFSELPGALAALGWP